jgi:hypothetical protein
VETAFDVPKLLQTVDTETTNEILIPNLDTASYERIYIMMSNFACTNVAYIRFGGMEGSTKSTANYWNWGGYQTNGNNRSASNSGTMVYCNAGSDFTNASTSSNNQNSTVEWNFFFPDPTGTVHEVTGNMNYMGGNYSHHQYNCWGNFMLQKDDQATHFNGIHFDMASGTFRKASNPFRTTVYGYKRRPAPTT